MKILGVKVNGRQGDETDFVMFRLSDVNWITMSRIKKKSDQVPIYHTAKGSYAPLLTLRDVSMSLKSKGFEYADKSTIVNKTRIQGRKKNEYGVDLVFIDGMTINISSRSIHSK